MSTKAYNKIKAEIKKELIREFIVPILSDLEDAEGTYKAKFVLEVQKIAQEKAAHVYNPKTFAGQIK